VLELIAVEVLCS